MRLILSQYDIWVCGLSARGFVSLYGAYSFAIYQPGIVTENGYRSSKSGTDQRKFRRQNRPALKTDFFFDKGSEIA